MVEQRRVMLLPLVGALMLVLLAGVFLIVTARKRLAKADDAGGVARHSVETSAADTLKYWTEERMRSAKPAKMPKVKKSKLLKDGKKHPKRPSV